MWIVADDASTPTKQVMQLLHRLNVTHKYLLGKIYIILLLHYDVDIFRVTSLEQLH